MSNVKQNVINIVLGLPPVEPGEVVAVPAEMTVEQAREVLANQPQYPTTNTISYEVVAEFPTQAAPVEHPEPSEDPTGYSGFSGSPGEQEWIEEESLKGGCMADFDEDGGVGTGDFFREGNHDKWKPFISFRMVEGSDRWITQRDDAGMNQWHFGPVSRPIR